jgi:hypothetical protein
VSQTVLAYLSGIDPPSRGQTADRSVDGTLQNVCHRHHTIKAHELVHDLHHAEHVASGRLEFGQSHNQGSAPPA